MVRRSSKILLVVLAVLACLCLSVLVMPSSSATSGDTTDPGHISWILVCSLLVFIMSPGVAFFYGGMLRKQSMGSIMAQTLIAMGVMSISWILVGYTLTFDGSNPVIGGLGHLLMNGVVEDATGGAISDMEFALFQMMFSMVAGALVLGAAAERIRYTAIVWFLAIWSIVIYAPMAHWVWGGGWFDQYLVVLDFAGGLVIHICAGITGLALVLFAGPRRASNRESRAHNVPLTFLGAALLWFGWFGFNGGSGLLADGQAVRVMFVSQVAAVFAMASWGIAQYLVVGRVGVLGLIAGAVSGLVAITPAAGYVGIPSSIVIGLVAGVLCFFSVRVIRNRCKLDDALDVFGVHGIGGIWGSIAVGLFANPYYSGGIESVFFGGSIDLLVGQIVASVFTLVYCFVVSYGIILILSKFMRVRVNEDEEMIGQDIIEHGEESYLM